MQDNRSCTPSWEIQTSWLNKNLISINKNGKRLSLAKRSVQYSKKKSVYCYLPFITSGIAHWENSRPGWDRQQQQVTFPVSDSVVSMRVVLVMLQRPHQDTSGRQTSRSTVSKSPKVRGGSPHTSSALNESILECPACRAQYPSSQHRELLAHLDHCLDWGAQWRHLRSSCLGSHSSIHAWDKGLGVCIRSFYFVNGQRCKEI